MTEPDHFRASIGFHIRSELRFVKNKLELIASEYTQVTFE